MPKPSLAEYLKLHPKKHLVFDFDETLAKIKIDWKLWHQGVKDIFHKFDPNFKPTQPRMDFHVNDFINRFGQPMVKALIDHNTWFESTHGQGFDPNPELISFVRQNKSHRMYVYSSNIHDTVLSGLKELGIAHKFTDLITRDKVTYIKPHPEGFSLIVKDNPESYLMIGDSNADKGAAEAAGIDFYQIDYFKEK